MGVEPGLILDQLVDPVTIFIRNDDEKGAQFANETSTDDAMNSDEVVIGQVDRQQVNGLHEVHGADLHVGGVAGRNDEKRRSGFKATNLE